MINTLALAGCLLLNLCRITGAGEIVPVRLEEPAAVVRMTDDRRYVPRRITVTAGDAVEWKNDSRFDHTVTADPSVALRGGDAVLPQGIQPFNSGNIAPGESFRHVFKRPGKYRYFCIPHELSGMVGEVVVLPRPDSP